jgi:ubiquinol-cytochrome c reductase cytochrome b subunit
MRKLKATYEWLEQRLQLEGPIKDAALHSIPRNTASWWYVFGSAAFTLLFLQIVTGILLAIVYVPSAGQAWNSLNVLNHQLELGWFLRAMHGWGSNFMVAVVLVHMAQVFMFGSYKYPRELTWTLGVFLLLMTLGMAFTGQVLRFDQDSYWGLGIGASIASRIPGIGASVVHLMLGGPIIAGATLSRFFTLHVFVIPGAMLLFASLHVWMVLKLGINEWPMPGRIVRRSTYLQDYHNLTHRDGVPFVPVGLWKDALFSGAIIAAVAVCAFVFGPYGPSGQPDPTIIHTVPNSYGSETRLLFPLDLRGLGLFAPIDGNALYPDRSSDRHCDSACSAVLRRGGGEELAPPSGCRVGAVHCSYFVGNPYPSSDLHSLEPAYGCVEQRPRPSAIFARCHATGPPGRGHFPIEAVP